MLVGSPESGREGSAWRCVARRLSSNRASPAADARTHESTEVPLGVYTRAARVGVVDASCGSAFLGWLRVASRLTQFVLVILVCLSS